jgi:hypothetical protein
MSAFDISHLRELQESFERRRNPDSEITLAPRVANPLKRALDSAPHFERLADGGKRVIRAIHGVVDLYEDAEHGDFEFYLGRCGATPDHLYSRFGAHFINKDHVGGIVAVRCDTEIVMKWECAAIRVLKGLKDRNRLCVANVACHGGGLLPSTEHSAIYLTWLVRSDTADITLPIRRDIDAIATEVAFRMDGDVSKDSITRAIDPITRPRRDRLPLDWARGHRG